MRFILTGFADRLSVHGHGVRARALDSKHVPPRLRHQSPSTTAAAHHAYRSARHPALLVAGILLIAASLRAPITALGPLLEPVRQSFALNASQAGLLTDAAAAGLRAGVAGAASIAHRHGLERTLFVSLLLLVAGIALRSAGSAWALYAGTCVIGGAIAIANVLLPSLLKRDFPRRWRLTAGYALSMIAAAGWSRPWPCRSIRALGAGWPASLGTVALLPLAAALLVAAARCARAPSARRGLPKDWRTPRSGRPRWPGRSRPTWG